MNNKYHIANSIEMNKRKLIAEKFYNDIFDPDEIPYIVTDEASLYDIFAGDEVELIQKIKEKYGVDISVEHFRVPIWKLLDYLEDNKKK